MRISQDEFRELQQHWYDLLKVTGFHDIEEFKGTDLVLKQSATYPLKHTDYARMRMQEEYFRLMGQRVNDESTVFRNDIDRYILVRFTEGAKCKMIEQELMIMGSSKHRHSIRFIIRRYEMTWGIKLYTPTQLNLKRPTTS